jgi:type VI secretion system secreted protein VgrG
VARTSASIEAIDLKQQFRPPRTTPKPLIQGAQTAIVVADSKDKAKNAEIPVDKHGRVRVKFHWDSKVKRSCWVRVAQIWSGQGWGAQFLPRTGQEVIVSFLEGDPDRPIITGSVYNGTHEPPYTLPDKATQSGIKSRSSKDGRQFQRDPLRGRKGQGRVLSARGKGLSRSTSKTTEPDGRARQRPACQEQEGRGQVRGGQDYHLDAGDEITSRPASPRWS